MSHTWKTVRPICRASVARFGAWFSGDCTLKDNTGYLLGRLVRVPVLFLPALLLTIAALRCQSQNVLMFWLAVLFQLLVCALALVSRQMWRQSMGPSVITLYVIALGWMWLGSAGMDDWYPHMAQAVLLVVPLAVFAKQMLSESGASAVRRARRLAQQLLQRRDWPADLAACRQLPEVKALREALHIDAGPALELLSASRVEVRVAALAALEFRSSWRRGQAEQVLALAQGAPEPAVRAAAITALANVDDRSLIEVLAEFLRDPSWEVRRAATEALLWDSERRWPAIRHAVRRCLGDISLKDDGPLYHDAQLLSAEAVADLTAWSAEKGLLAMRAAVTLGAHYRRVLGDRPNPTLVAELRQKLANPHAPPALRMELAWLLKNGDELDRELLEKLLDPANPAPLRLLAAEALLAREEHPEALSALRDLARLPNREIAVATADVLQRRLNIDLGLPVGQPLPPVNSRQAAEVTRRVMLWAAQPEQPCLRE
jgi:HEAT repeat protein